MVYLLILFFILISCLDIGQRKSKSVDQILYFFLFLVFVLLAGLRYRVGGDSLAYQDYFNTYPNFSQLKHFDFKDHEYRPLWYILNAVIKSIYNDFSLFQFVQATFVNGVVFWFIKKYCTHKYVGILFYFLLEYTYFNMEILRETFPICIFLISIPYLLKRKWIKYYLLSIIAIYFHFSAVITFAIPFLHRKMKIWYIAALIILVWIPFTFFNPYEVFQVLYFTPAFSRKVEAYTTLYVNIYGILMAIIGILPVLAFKLIRHKCKLPEHTFENLITAYIIIGFFSPFVGGFSRFLNYLAIIAIIYVVDTLFLLRSYKIYFSRSYLIAQGFIILLFSYQTYYYFRDTSRYEKDTRFYDLYIPYNSILNSRKDYKRESLYFNLMGMTHKQQLQ